MEFLLLSLAGSLVVRRLLAAYAVSPLVSLFVTLLWLAACLTLGIWWQLP